MRIGFIGTGRITRRMVGALAGDGHEIMLTRRSESVSSELAAARRDVTVVDDPQAVVDRGDVIFVCLAADPARKVLPTLAFRADQAVVSVMAGIGIDELRAVVAPATDLCITIPMPFVEQGGCPLPTYPRSAALESLLGARNPVIPVASEDALAPFWAVSGTMASVLAELQTMVSWLGDRIGEPAAAERYVAHLYGGYLGTLEKDGNGRLEAALGDLSIEGGLNATLRERVTASGHYEKLRSALDVLHARVKG